MVRGLWLLLVSTMVGGSESSHNPSTTMSVYILHIDCTCAYQESCLHYLLEGYASVDAYLEFI